MIEAGDTCLILGYIPQRFLIVECGEAPDTCIAYGDNFNASAPGRLASIAPVAFPLKALMDALSTQMAPNEFLTPAYDPELKIESTITQVRAVREATTTVPLLDGNRQPRLMPIFGFKTAAIKWSVLGRRGTRQVILRDPNNHALQMNFYVYQGQVDVGFALFHNSLQMLEMYEVAYMSKARFSNIRHLEVTYPDPIGVLPYQITWGELDDKLTFKQPVEHQALVGIFRIEGPFIVFDETPNTLINKVVFEIMNWQQAVFNPGTSYTYIGQGEPARVGMAIQEFGQGAFEVFGSQGIPTIIRG